MRYTCPFCGAAISDTIESLVAHREPGGVCDQRMDEQSQTNSREE